MSDAVDGACIEHVWVTTGVVMAADGTHIEKACDRCGAVAVVGPDEVAGRA